MQRRSHFCVPKCSTHFSKYMIKSPLLGERRLLGENGIFPALCFHNGTQTTESFTFHSSVRKGSAAHLSSHGVSDKTQTEAPKWRSPRGDVSSSRGSAVRRLVISAGTGSCSRLCWRLPQNRRTPANSSMLIRGGKLACRTGAPDRTRPDLYALGVSGRWLVVTAAASCSALTRRRGR